jgi:hypothetical protein
MFSKLLRAANELRELGNLKDELNYFECLERWSIESGCESSKYLAQRNQKAWGKMVNAALRKGMVRKGD